MDSASPGSSTQALEAVSRIVLRFEEAWRAGQPPTIEDYLPAGELRPRALVELLHAELELRLQVRGGKGRALRNTSAAIRSWPGMRSACAGWRRPRPAWAARRTGRRPTARVWDGSPTAAEGLTAAVSGGGRSSARSYAPEVTRK